MWPRSDLLKKSLVENFIFYIAIVEVHHDPADKRQGLYKSVLV